MNDDELDVKKSLSLKQIVIKICLLWVLFGVMYLFWGRPEPRVSELLMDRMVEEGGVEFLTIHPYSGSLTDLSKKHKYATLGNSHWIVLDVKPLEDTETLESMFDGLLWREVDLDGKDKGLMPMCFWPRHAFRLNDEPNSYLLVCFECDQFKAFYEGVGHEWGLLDGEKSEEKKMQCYAMVESMGMVAPPETMEEVHSEAEQWLKETLSDVESE